MDIHLFGVPYVKSFKLQATATYPSTSFEIDHSLQVSRPTKVRGKETSSFTFRLSNGTLSFPIYNHATII